MTVEECDVDADADLVRRYTVLNVPAVALADHPELPPIVGAFRADDLVRRIREMTAAG